MTYLPLEFDKYFHQIYSSLEVSCFLIIEAQVPAGNRLTTSVSDLAGDLQGLLEVIDCLDGLAQVGVGKPKVAQVGSFPSLVSNLAVYGQSLVVVLDCLASIA